jgi:hypothetical protein
MEGRFLAALDQRITLAPLGRSVLDLADLEEPSDEVRLLFVSSLLLRDPPMWVAFWQGDPDNLGLAIPDSERALLEQCGLYPQRGVDDLASWAWWDALKEVPLAEQTGPYRKLIGDAGEQLSLAYERTRLDAEGFPDLSRRVRWVARESAAYGFDVLSYSGRSDSNPIRQLAIEVKSIAPRAGDVFPFYLSEHEWRTSTALASAYVFHLWDGVDPVEPPRSQRNPWIVMPQQVTQHVPGRPGCGHWCSWTTARIELPVRCDSR